jgi:hypothetical protein
MKKTVLQVQECEARLVPSAAIETAQETYAWVLINTLRENPTAFASDLQGLVNGSTGSAFGLTPKDPAVTDLKSLINAARFPANYPAALNLMRSTPAAGPLAWDEVAESRAEIHTNWMKANGFAHTGATGPRAAIPGFSKNDSAPADQWGYGVPTYTAWGEDIGWAAGSLRSTKAAYNTGSISLTGLRQRAAFLDTMAYMLELNSGSLGHLRNLLGRDTGAGGELPAYNTIGVDTDMFQAPVGYEVQDGVPESWISTHRFGYTRPGGSGGFVAGIAYQDHNSNGYYDAGEGTGLTVNIRNASGGGVTVNTDDHGAFSEYLSNGTYAVTFSAGGQTLGTQSVSINNGNAWASLQIGGLGRPDVTSPTGSQSILRPTVTWNGVDGATGYEVRVDDRTVRAGNVFPNATTGGTDWSPPTDLVSGRTYRVTARALTGTSPGQWGTPTDFTVAVPTAHAPAGTTADIRPDFAWSGVSGASRYIVRVDDLSANRPNIFPNLSTTDTWWEPGTDLASGRTYRWQVRAVNAAGLGSWSAPKLFTVGKPVQTGPANGVTHLRPTLTWTGVGAVTAYEVRVTDISAGGVIRHLAKAYTTNWAPPADLVSGRTYTWQVRAVNALGQGRWSAPTTLVLGKPTLTGPVGDVWNRRPTFTWTGIGAAPRYQVRLDDATTGQTAYVSTVGGLDWTPPRDLVPGHIYRWYARAMNSAGFGMWSAPGAIRVL